MARFGVGLSLVFLAWLSAVAQNAPPSDPYAVDLANKSIQAMAGGATISDATLTGTSKWTVGNDSEDGQATLLAKGVGEGRIDLALSSEPRSEIRNNLLEWPAGATILNKGEQTSWAPHNCWTSPNWFFPALSSLAATSDPALVWSYVGQEKHNGQIVEHIRAYRFVANPPSNTEITRALSTEEFFLDSRSFLPAAIMFTTHPDDNALLNFQIEVDFSGYQQVTGALIPFRIQKLVSGGLQLDLSLTGASLNSGLSDSLFAISE
jgi:hypothetical protein